MNFIIIGYSITRTLMPIIVFMFLQCFYDDSIQITGKKIGMYLLPGVLTGTLIELSVFTDVIPFQPVLENLAELFYLIVPVVIFCERNRPVKYYIKNLILTAILSVFFWVIVNAFAIANCMILVRIKVITSDDYDIPCCFLTLFSMILMILWLYVAFIRKQLTIFMRRRDTFLFFIYFIVAVLIFVANSYNKEYGWDEPWMIFVSVKLLMLFFILFMPAIIIKSRQNIYYTELSIRNEQFLEMQLTASKAYRQSQEDTRAFRHDMNNNLMIISAMMQKKQYNNAEEYINSLFEKLSSFSPKIVTGDSMLDSLFASKLPVMDEKSIRFEISGVIDSLDWQPIDICAIFANLIDNAIEACEKVTAQNRYIKVRIRKTDLQYIITFHNSVAQLVDCSKLNENSQYTSKPDRSCHGFGMKNIRHTLAKYGALMQIDCTDTEFTTQIIIIK